MDIFVVTFEAVAALLFIGIVGFYVISRKVLPENAITILAALTIDIALPSLVFVNIVTQFDPAAMQDWWLFPVYFIIYMSFGLLLARFLTIVLSAKHKNEFTASVFYQNAVFFPIAIIGSWHCSQDQLLVKLFFFTLLFAPFYFTTAPMFFSKSGKISKSKVFNPVLIVTILAMGFVFSGIDKFVPDFVISSLLLLGKMAAPLLMLIFGGSIYLDYKNKGKLEIVEVVKFVLARNFIFPAIMVLVLFLLRPNYELAFLLILQASVPPITSLPVIAKQHGGNTKIINQFMIASFIVSLFTIPLYLMIFEKMYAA
ncbi:MAG: AEC family transporter [Sedimentisphaeraceae bacterium JB056]